MADEACSRSRSRVARALIKSRGLVPRQGVFGGGLPDACPLVHDVFGAHEAAKKAVRHNVWRCRFCGKSFVSEAWLDNHLALRHADSLPSNGTAYCLGDLCDVLDCAASPHLAGTPLDRDRRDRVDDDDRERRRRRRGRAFKRSSELATPCDAASLEAAKARCRAVVSACFPPDGGPHAGLCEPRCSNGRVLVDRGGRGGRPDDGGAPGGGAPRVYAAFLVVFYGMLLYFYKQRRDAAGRAPAPSRRAAPAKRAARRD